MRLLAIVAHPDDADIFCGGTLAKHAANGDDVGIIHLTRGEYGGLEGESEDIATVREAEARASADTLGADIGFLDFHDGRITYSMVNRLALVDVIREYKPKHILTHYREDMHPDHRVTSRLVTDAYYMASLPLVNTHHPAHDPTNIYYFGKPTAAFEPYVFVDTTDYQTVKEDAIECHESQVAFLQEHGGIDAEFDGLIEGIRAEARVRGKRTGARYAEGFEPLHVTAQTYL